MKVHEGRGLQVAGVGGCTYLVRTHDARKEVIDMRKRSIATLVAVSVFTALGMTHASADAPKPGASMTHIKTIAGLSAALKSAGVIIYAQGGATSGVMGDSIGSANGQKVLHVPVTGTKTGVEHVGSTIVFYNINNDKTVTLRNPLINLAAGTISAVVPEASAEAMTVLSITNASALKPKVTNDKKAKLRSTAYSDAALSFAPGIAPAVVSLLGLPAGALADGASFATAGVTLYSPIKGK